MNKFAPPKRLHGIEKSVIRQVFDRAKPGSINLGLGEPDLPTPDVIRRAAVKAIVMSRTVTLRTRVFRACAKKSRLITRISSNGRSE